MSRWGTFCSLCNILKSVRLTVKGKGCCSPRLIQDFVLLPSSPAVQHGRTLLEMKYVRLSSSVGSPAARWMVQQFIIPSSHSPTEKIDNRRQLLPFSLKRLLQEPRTAPVLKPFPFFPSSFPASATPSASEETRSSLTFEAGGDLGAESQTLKLNHGFESPSPSPVCRHLVRREHSG